MHKLQNPAVTRPQMTLVAPPEVRLIDRLADRAVHD